MPTREISGLINLELARSLFMRKDYEGAVRFSTAAGSIRPGAAADAILGDALANHKKFDEALALCRRGTELDPKSPLAYWSLGKCLRDCPADRP